MGKTGYSVIETKKERNYRNYVYWTFNEKLVSARMKEVFHLIKEEDSSFTQTELARLLHVRQQRISDYLDGRTLAPYAVLINFAEWSGEDIYYLLGKTDTSRVRERQHRELVELEKEHKGINEHK